MNIEPVSVVWILGDTVISEFSTNPMLNAQRKTPIQCVSKSRIPKPVVAVTNKQVLVCISSCRHLLSRQEQPENRNRYKQSEYEGLQCLHAVWPRNSSRNERKN